MSLTLYNGDCLEVMKQIPDKSIDCIICDLPYGCLRKKKGEKGKILHWRKERCDWDIKIDLTKFWEQARRILKNKYCPVIHFCTTKFGYELIKSNEAWFRYDLIWDKKRGVSFLSANKMPMRSHEMIYVFAEAGAEYRRIDISGNFRPSVGGGKGSNTYGMSKTSKGTGSTNTRCALSVIQISNSASEGRHPTEKPIELYRWLIERYVPEGGTMLDPTFGSGNSVWTAANMGRHAIGIEMDEKFFELAVKKMTAQDIQELPVNEIIQSPEQNISHHVIPQSQLPNGEELVSHALHSAAT